MSFKPWLKRVDPQCCEKRVPSWGARLMGFEAGLPASTRRQYRRIWRQENQYYFGVAGHLLAAAWPSQTRPIDMPSTIHLRGLLRYGRRRIGQGSIAWRRAWSTPPDDDDLHFGQVLQITQQKGQAISPHTTPFHGCIPGHK